MKKIIMLTALMALTLFAGGCGSGQAAATGRRRVRRARYRRLKRRR